MVENQLTVEDRFSLENIISVFEEKLKNKSGRGIDGVNSLDFSERLIEISESISSKVLSGKYRYSPYLEILKSKGRGKSPRIISKPTIKDKLVLSLVKDELHDRFPDCISRKLPNVHIREIREFLESTDVSNLSFIKVDIKKFYDSISREILLSKIEGSIGSDQVLSLIKRAVINRTVPQNYKKENSALYYRENGVPQGLSISNILASIYLHDFDKEFLSLGVQYTRYVDDVLIISSSDEVESIKSVINKEMEAISLEVHSDEKSDSGPITNPFDFLGYYIEFPLISVRKSTEERFVSSIAAMFTDIKHNANWIEGSSKWLSLDQVKEIFILRLNEKITGAISEDKRYGWVFYFLEINDLDLLHRLDAIVRSFFKRLEIFDRKPDAKLKSLARTYFEAKYSASSGYIHNYNDYSSAEKKLGYLVRFGYISHYDGKKYTSDEIERMFNRVKHKHIVKLEADLGSLS